MSNHRPGPPLNRIPGAIKTKSEYSKDLKLLSYNELLEMKERQGKLLSMKKRLQQLPDKGKRLQDAFDKLLVEIARRDDVEAAAAMLSELNIAAKGKTALNNLEWHGRLGYIENEDSHVGDILDSDDELELDPLRVIAQRTMHERQVKVLPPPETLITSADLIDIASFKNTSADSGDSAQTNQSDTSSAGASESIVLAEIIEIDAAQLSYKLEEQVKPVLEPHALYLINKTELQARPATTEKFRPFRTTITNVHDPANERVRKKHQHWEITAATPPLIQHKEAQLVPLSESAYLQTEYLKRVKAQREKQAEERLARQQGTSAIRLPEDSILKTKSSFKTYRDPHINYIEGRQHASELNNEVHDPTDVDKATGITYSVYN